MKIIKFHGADKGKIPTPFVRFTCKHCKTEFIASAEGCWCCLQNGDVLIECPVCKQGVYSSKFVQTDHKEERQIDSLSSFKLEKIPKLVKEKIKIIQDK